MNIILLFSSFLCLIFGIVKYSGKKTALFCVLVTGAVACFFMEHLYDTIMLLNHKEISRIFNIGMLARVGGYAFIFSASYAQMDGLVDDKSKDTVKYRLAALIAPIVIVGLYVPIAASDISGNEKLTTGIMFAFASIAAYYNLKHLIIKDVCLGIIYSIRLYSLFSLICTIGYCTAVLCEKLDFRFLSAVFSLSVACTYPLFTYFMEKGRQKWTA